MHTWVMYDMRQSEPQYLKTQGREIWIEKYVGSPWSIICPQLRGRDFYKADNRENLTVWFVLYHGMNSEAVLRADILCTPRSLLHLFLTKHFCRTRCQPGSWILSPTVSQTKEELKDIVETSPTLVLQPPDVDISANDRPAYLLSRVLA